jgi:predicted ATPase
MLGRSCWLAAEKGDVDAVRGFAPVWRRLAQQYGLEIFALGAQFFAHWAAVHATAVHTTPPLAEDIEQMHQAMEAYRTTGTTLNRTAFLVFFAEACGKAGQIARGLAAVEESLFLAEQTGELWFQATAWRVKGELLAQQAGHGVAPAAIPGAAACFEMARQVAAQQGVKSLPLRASNLLSILP